MMTLHLPWIQTRPRVSTSMGHWRMGRIGPLQQRIVKQESQLLGVARFTIIFYIYGRARLMYIIMQ
jgi:hypothetical protein